MKKAQEFLKSTFEGHEINLYDLDDAIYVEDVTTGKSYTYIIKTGKLISHTN